MFSRSAVTFSENLGDGAGTDRRLEVTPPLSRPPLPSRSERPSLGKLLLELVHHDPTVLDGQCLVGGGRSSKVRRGGASQAGSRKPHPSKRHPTWGLTTPGVGCRGVKPPRTCLWHTAEGAFPSNQGLLDAPVGFYTCL